MLVRTLISTIVLSGAIGQVKAQETQNAPSPDARPIAQDQVEGQPVAYQDAPSWRYRFQDGLWWYWTSNNAWMVYVDGQWIPYEMYAQSFSSDGYYDGSYGQNYAYGSTYPGYGYGYGGYGGYGYGRGGWGRPLFWAGAWWLWNGNRWGRWNGNNRNWNWNWNWNRNNGPGIARGNLGRGVIRNGGGIVRGGRGIIRGGGGVVRGGGNFIRGGGGRAIGRGFGGGGRRLGGAIGRGGRGRR